MVSDYIPKSVPRSLVRVPGSGCGKGATAPAISCDLGKVSSLAASIPVNPYLPAVMTGSKLFLVPSVNKVAGNKLATSEFSASMPGCPAGPSRRRSRSYEAAGQESKRPRLDACTPSSNSASSRVVELNIRSSQLMAASSTISSGGQEMSVLTAIRRLSTATRSLPNAVPLPDDINKSLEELQEERRRLYEENQMLLRHLCNIQFNNARDNHVLGTML